MAHRQEAGHPYGRYYYESRLYVSSVKCLTPEGAELRPFEFKNLKSIIKYRASIAIVGVV